MAMAACQTRKPVDAGTAPFRSNRVTTSSFSKM
eukprot:CAMPEP_0119555140 /NCGR_PEP_ID=MMETSP1352-20130426/7443_1 /TAXON_ID=265584 /ORGANISM="Stauroneis constricta, Strain CCMP1120" /LENGTH=32 /DNA_ID= /DNA_START= /DNA_END= /DNA_ORIENTATION=